MAVTEHKYDYEYEDVDAPKGADDGFDVSGESPDETFGELTDIGAIDPDADDQQENTGEPATSEGPDETGNNTHNTEMDALRREVAELRQARQQEQATAQTALQNQELDQQIAEQRSSMVEAQENGDIEKAAEIEDKLFDLRMKRRLAGSTAPQGSTVPDTTTDAAADQVAANIPEAAQGWLTNNSYWFNNPKYREEAQAAVRIEQELRQSGADPYDPKTYQEIDKRLKDRFPDTFSKGAKSTRNGPPNGMGAQSANRSGRVTITANDKKLMREFGLDPQNPKHQKEWAQNKRTAKAS